MRKIFFALSYFIIALSSSSIVAMDTNKEPSMERHIKLAEEFRKAKAAGKSEEADKLAKEAIAALPQGAETPYAAELRVYLTHRARFAHGGMAKNVLQHRSGAPILSEKE